MNDETSVRTTPHRCPECGGPIRMEVTRGEATSVVYECAECRTTFTLLELRSHEMQIGLDEWVPEGSEVHRASPNSLNASRELIGWRIEFPDGVVSRVSFWSSDVENDQADLWTAIQSHSLLQGKPGNMRIVARGGVIIPNPREWRGW